MIKLHSESVWTIKLSKCFVMFTLLCRVSCLSCLINKKSNMIIIHYIILLIARRTSNILDLLPVTVSESSPDNIKKEKEKKERSRIWNYKIKRLNRSVHSLEWFKWTLVQYNDKESWWCRARALALNVSLNMVRVCRLYYL